MQDLLNLKRLDLDLYVADCETLFKPIGSKGVYGGQIVGLALHAATLSSAKDLKVHSLHSYFLLPGDNSLNILFYVSRIRDGKTYSTRNIVAKQSEKVIFTMMVGLFRPEFSTLAYQPKMPIVPLPETLKSEKQRLLEWLEDPKLLHCHEDIRKLLEIVDSSQFAIDVRIVGVKQSGSDTFGARQLLWIKTASEIPNVSTFHQCVAAYASDFELLKTTLRPHGFTRYNLTRKPNRPTLASLDHAMWFHEEFRVDDWLLYEIEAHKTHGGRGYATGRIWTLNGKLVASTAQEGMAREQKPKL